MMMPSSCILYMPELAAASSLSGMRTATRQRSYEMTDPSRIIAVLCATHLYRAVIFTFLVFLRKLIHPSSDNVSIRAFLAHVLIYMVDRVTYTFLFASYLSSNQFTLFFFF